MPQLKPAKKKPTRKRRRVLPKPRTTKQNQITASPTIILGWNVVLVGAFNLYLMLGEGKIGLGLTLSTTLLMAGYVLSSYRLWVRGRLDQIPVDQAAVSGLVPILFFLGSQLSSEEVFSMKAMPFYAAANLVFLYVVIGRSGLNTPVQEKPPPLCLSPDPGTRMPKVWAFLAACSAIPILIFLVRNYALNAYHLPDDIYSLHLFYQSRQSSALDIAGGAFHNYSSLWAPLIYLVVLLGGTFFFMTTKTFRPKTALLFLLGAALLGKLAVAHLATPGLGILGKKITSIHNNYYDLADQIDSSGLVPYLKSFNSLQLAQGNHGDTHPFGPVVLYWLLKKTLASNPTLVALAIMFLSGLTIWPLFLLCTDLFGNAKFGYVAAALYLSSPMSLILSSAGIDSLVLTIMVTSFYFLNKAIKTQSIKAALIGGGFIFLNSLFTVGATLFLMFCGLWTLWLCQMRASSLLDWFQKTIYVFAVYLAPLFFLHLLLFLCLGGQFDYTQVMETALHAHRGMNSKRAYDLWVWANVALYVGYAGIPLVAAWLVQTLKTAWSGNWRDPFFSLSLPFLFTLVFSCMGRAEVQREFLYGFFFLLIPAVALLASPTKMTPVQKKTGWQAVPQIPLALLLVALNFSNAVLLEVTVLDFW